MGGWTSTFLPPDHELIPAHRARLRRGRSPRRSRRTELDRTNRAFPTRSCAKLGELGLLRAPRSARRVLAGAGGDSTRVRDRGRRRLARGLRGRDRAVGRRGRLASARLLILVGRSPDRGIALRPRAQRPSQQEHQLTALPSRRRLPRKNHARGARNPDNDSFDGPGAHQPLRRGSWRVRDRLPTAAGGRGVAAGRALLAAAARRHRHELLRRAVPRAALAEGHPRVRGRLTRRIVDGRPARSRCSAARWCGSSTPRWPTRTCSRTSTRSPPVDPDDLDFHRG